MTNKSILNIAASVFSVIIFLFLESCSVIKTTNIFQSGGVDQSEFDKTLPFQFENGLIIIDVVIKNKTYKFLLDSGAPNIISKQIADELDLPIKFSSTVSGSQNKSELVDFVKIENISIAGVNFRNTGSIVADLEGVINKVACFNIDGVIGANLMRNAIWDIDYDGKLIRLVSNSELLKIPTNSKAIPFITDLSGSPIIKMKVNDGLSVEVEVDLGMQSDFSLSQNVLKKLNKENDISKISGFGTLSGSLFGYAEPEKDEFAIISAIVIGSTRLNNQVVTFIDNGKTQKIGTKFLKNYRVIFNWFNKELHLIKKKDYYNNEETFGIKFRYDENSKVIVSYVYENSSAFKTSLKFGDEVSAINGENLESISQIEWCNFLTKSKFLFKDSLMLSINRNNNLETIVLKKSSFF